MRNSRVITGALFVFVCSLGGLLTLVKEVSEELAEIRMNVAFEDLETSSDFLSSSDYVRVGKAGENSEAEREEEEEGAEIPGVIGDATATNTTKNATNVSIYKQPKPATATVTKLPSSPEKNPKALPKNDVSNVATPKNATNTTTSIEPIKPAQNPKVLLGIVSSREKLDTRAKVIMKTWAKNVPQGVVPMVFVGSSEVDDGISSGSPEDIARLSQAAGIHNTSKVKIVVMKGIPDDEYPPVYKNTGMVKHLNRMAESLEAEGQKVDWAFKVDDDAYVHFRGLVKFLMTRNPEKDGYYGEQGTGRRDDREGLAQAGLKGPFCMGGSGWIMSRSTLRKAAMAMDKVVETANKSKYRKFIWHSDTVIGLAVQESTGNNCWTDNDYLKYRVFRHNYNTKVGANFLSDVNLKSIVVMHPFKDEKIMAALHARFQRVVG